MEYQITEMKLNKYSELMDFWKGCGGLFMSDDDTYENMDMFLKRNPELNYLVLHENRIIAAIKCSHDGRRGYIHHLAVKEEFRKQGIARKLINKCLNNLQSQGIQKIRVFVMDTNEDAIRFWKHAGFEEQIYDYRTFQLNNTA